MVGERFRLHPRLVGSQLELGEPKLVSLLEQLRDPFAGRVHLEPVAGVRRDERPAGAALLHRQIPVECAREHRLEVLLVERDAEVVDPR